MCVCVCASVREETVNETGLQSPHSGRGPFVFRMVCVAWQTSVRRPHTKFRTSFPRSSSTYNPREITTYHFIPDCVVTIGMEALFSRSPFRVYKSPFPGSVCVRVCVCVNLFVDGCVSVSRVEPPCVARDWLLLRTFSRCPPAHRVPECSFLP